VEDRERKNLLGRGKLMTIQVSRMMVTADWRNCLDFPWTWQSEELGFNS
jgi:hypothetical protein